MWRDIKLAARALARAPIFTLTATLALGLAVGANAAIFGLIDGLWFRPPGVTSPGEIVRAFSTTPENSQGSWSFPEYASLRDDTAAFSGVIARGRRGAMLAAPDGRPELLLVNVVSLNFFTTLGVAPAHGRLFAPTDAEALDAQPGVVLGHAFWLRRFGGDPGIVGREIPLDRGRPLPVTVLGVLPATFRELDAAADRDLWLPVPTWVHLAGREELESRDYRWFEVFARTQDGASLSAAQAEVQALAASMANDFPATNAGRSARVVSDLAHRLDTGGMNAAALLGLVLLVVLITCVNLANLLVARGAARARELAVRTALGATRWRLLRQLMTESLLIGALGAAAGLLLASWLIGALPPLLGTPPGFRSFLLFQVDARLVLFTFGVTLVTTVLFGVAPSWLAARSDVLPVIKGDSGFSGSIHGDRAMRRGLVVAQVAVSLVLLCAAAVLARSFIETGRADLGITRAPLLTTWSARADVPAEVLEAGMADIAALPGVRRVAIALRAPLSLSGGGYARPVSLPGDAPDPTTGVPDVKFNAVSANYFATIGTRLLRGRVFDDAEERRGEPVVVVNEAFAARFFPGRNALDEVVRVGGPSGADHRIVGIVQNAVINSIGEPPEPYMYTPFWRGEYGEFTLFVDAPPGPTTLAAAVRDRLKAIDTQLDPRQVVTMGQYIEYSASRYRATAALAAGLGLLGLLLTVIGVYGVMAYQTTRRAKEMAVRLAIGAPRASVVRLVVGEGTRLALVGVVLGVPAALATTRLMASLLFGTGPWDPLAFVGSAVTLIVAVAAATFVPAWRSSRVNLLAGLRDG